MTHRKGAIWTERMLLGLILVSVAATLNLLLLVYRQAPAGPSAATAGASSQTIAENTAPTPATESPPAAPLEQASVDDSVAASEPESQPPSPPVEDPTQKAVGTLAAATAKETAAALATDQRTVALEAGLRAASAESQRWKRRELLVRQQIAGIAAQADRLEREADALEAERDVLEHERDATKAALAKASKRSGFAVLPYKGPNGTWRRPIVIECMAGGAKLQPQGPRFTTMDLSPRIHPRSSVFVKAIARELLHIRSAETPDGTPAIPYITFLVRPDGIGPYYLARTCLEPLGIAFGYELVEQNLAVNIPDFDDLTTWDGSVPLDIPLEPAPGSGSNATRFARGDSNGSTPGAPSAGFPGADAGASGGSLDGSSQLTRQGNANAAGGGGGTGPEDFVWPGRSRPASRDGGRSASLAAAGEPGNQVARGGPVSPLGGSGSDGTRPEGGPASPEAFPGPALSSGEGSGLAGILEKPVGTETAANANQGTARVRAGGAAERGLADQPGGTGSGMGGSSINPEDLGTGTNADPAARPFAAGNALAGGRATGQVGSGAGANRTGGPATGPTGPSGGLAEAGGLNSAPTGSGGGANETGGLFQVPNFEPAGDQAGMPSSLTPAGAPATGGSLVANGAVGQAPSSGVGQVGTGSSSANGGDSAAAAARSLTQSGGALSTSASGSGVAGALGMPSASLAPGAGGSGVAGTFPAPSAILPQGASGSGIADSVGLPPAATLPQAAGAPGPLAPDSTSSPATDAGSKSRAGSGMGADPRPGDLESQDALGNGSSGTPPTGMGARGSRGQRFDWDQAAQDGTSAGSMPGLGSDPALGAQLPDLEASPATAAGAQGDPPPTASQYPTSPQPTGPNQSATAGALGNPPHSSTQNQSSLQAARSAFNATAGALPNPPAGTQNQVVSQPSSISSTAYPQIDPNTASALSGLSSMVSPSVAANLAQAVSSSTSSGSGTTSSSTSSTSQPNSQSGGMPMGGNTQPSTLASPSSNLSFGQNSSSDSSSDPANELIMPPRPKPTPPMGSIDVRFEIVVVCRKDEVVLHPGSYRLTSDLLRSEGQGQDSLVAREIRAMVRKRAIVDPMIRQQPSLRFLVESQGADTFAIVRRQLFFSLPDWPVSLQVAGSQNTGIFGRNLW